MSQRFHAALMLLAFAALAGCTASPTTGTTDMDALALADGGLEEALAADVRPAADAVLEDAASEAAPEDATSEATPEDTTSTSEDATSETTAEDAPPEIVLPVRIAVISDTHVVPDVSSQQDERFSAVLELFAAQSPKVDLVFNTGDNLEVLLCSPEDAEAYVNGSGPPIESLEVYRGLIQDHTPAPFNIVLGNHDDRYLAWFTDKEIPLAAWLKAFQDTGMFPAAYYAVERQGFLFLVLDSTDLADSHDSNDRPTFGETQLTWLDTQLSRGLPAIIFWHHFIPQPPANATDLSPFLELLKRHKDVVKATFAGHDHQFHRYQWEGIAFYETASTADSPAPAYHLVDCDPTTGIVTIVNEGDNVYPD